ncbi:MAG: hypothetical protein O7G85_02120, partial [Planctomycetota bacterium]|nr:hypothetical protein [Planctomycetota bacterium]
GLARLFLPFGSAQWPARTGVESYMHQVLEGREIFPRDVALPLRAHVTRGADDQRVDAHYRVQIDGRFGNWQHIVMTHQSEGVHERLVDTNAEVIEFYFGTIDANTPRERVTLVMPPAIIATTLIVTPPAYASGRFPEYTAQLGPGLDDRAVTDTPSLIGSQVRMNIELNKPLPVPEPGVLRERWIEETFGFSSDESISFDHDVEEPSQWTLRWLLQGTKTIEVNLEDEYELTSSEPISFRINAVEDFPPSVTITQPQADETVLATAVVPLIGEASDDVAVNQLGLEAAVRRSGVDQPDDEEALPSEWREFRDVDAKSATIEMDLDLSTLELVEGDIVLVTGVAQDIYELHGATHEPVRSTVRRLRVISELELATHLRRQLAAVRHNAIRIEAHQGELQDDITEEGVQPGTDRAQGQIGDRVSTQLEEVRQIREQMQRNQLEDEQLQELLRQSEDLLDFAGRASSKASEQIERRKSEQAQEQAVRQSQGTEGSPSEQGESSQGEDQSQPGGEGQTKPGETGQSESGQSETGQGESGASGEAGEPDDEIFDLDDVKEAAEEDREIVEQQQEVRNELADLIELLDRDEDTWVVTRQIKQLLEEQTKLAAETGQLSRETLGQTREQLTAEQKSELDRIRDKQMELRDRARQLTESARDRAEAIEEHDPQAAEGMRAAAAEAEQRELDRDMEQAAQRAGENRLQQASKSQQRSMETLKRMLEKMEETKQAKAEELLRQLASLIESIERLINIQENELTSLARAIDDENFTDRDRAMIRLNQNTLAVAAEARSAGQESRRIARALDRAADAQGAAVVALRAIPINATSADEAENRSLELLKMAKELAEELQEQTQEEETKRQREELIEAYRGFAEQEVALRMETLGLSGNDQLDRRQLVEARRQGSVQERIRSGLDELRSRSSELMEAKMFSLVHQLIDDWASVVSDRLIEGEVGVDVTDRQLQIADSLGRLIAALEETMLPPEEFAKDQQQGDAGGGGGQQQKKQLIPPVAELKLLQGMQEHLYNQTRNIDGRGDLEPAQRRARLRDLGQQQRDLMEIGQDLIESMTGQGPSPAVDRDPDADDDEETNNDPA